MKILIIIAIIVVVIVLAIFLIKFIKKIILDFIQMGETARRNTKNKE